MTRFHSSSARITCQNGSLMLCNRLYYALLVLLYLPRAALIQGLVLPVSTQNNINNHHEFQNIHLLILPGFGNESNDYIAPPLPSSTSTTTTSTSTTILQQQQEKQLQETASLVMSLQKRHWSSSQIHVLPVRRIDWIKVFLYGILDWDFWCANAPPTRPAFAWYLQRIIQQVNAICQENDHPNNNNNNTRVVLICHSAGGWLARAALGFHQLQNNNNQEGALDLQRIAGIVTLGSPHLPPPPFAIEYSSTDASNNNNNNNNNKNAMPKKKKLMDMTRGALRITNEQFPGAYFKQFFYITVIGNAIQGNKSQQQQQESKLSSLRSSSRASEFAYNSYQVVCGNGNAMGDGVVPIDAAHLTDAVQLTLDNVWHSINVPQQWYGSDTVIDAWHNVMIQQLKQQQQSQPIQQDFNAKGGIQDAVPKEEQ